MRERRRCANKWWAKISRKIGKGEVVKGSSREEIRKKIR